MRCAVYVTLLVIFCIFRYYCELQSNSSQQTICTAGSYCPQGSGNPTPCPRGTYSNTPGLANETQCTACDPGKYCNDTGKEIPCTNIDIISVLEIELKFEI